MTLEEMKEFVSQFEECEGCPFADNYQTPYGDNDIWCYFGICPSNWGDRVLKFELNEEADT